jgi:hypothetical protein
MNLRSINSVASTWKRIKIQYVTLAAGLALAMSVAAAAGAFDRGAAKTPAASVSSQESTLGTNRGTDSSTVSTPVPQTIVYIVDSQLEADAIETAAVQEALLVVNSGQPWPNIQRVFLVADNPAAYEDAQQHISQMSWDFWTGGTLGSLTIFDLHEAS